MPKFFETYSKWKSLGEGMLAIILGLLLICFGQIVPRLGYQLLMAYFSLSTVWHLLTRWFQEKSRRENIFVTLAKLGLAVILFDSVILQGIALYVLVIAIGSYQLFTGLISLITWLIYRNNHIHPRLNYLFDALWMMGFGLYSISPFHDATNFELLLLGFYLLMLGASSLRDGFFFEKGIRNPRLKRKIRMTLPIFVTALIPISTLRRLNKWFSNHEFQEGTVHSERKNDQTVDLEIFIHTSESSFFLAMGHVDICYQGQVISYGSYDPHSERLFGMIGDGVLFKANREKYIELCKRESQKTLFAYGLNLSEQQKKAIEEQLREIEELLIPWEPSSQLMKRREGEIKHTYSYQLKHEADATLYKFSSSKFKTYFVLSTNCVLLADSIVGKAGTDILSPQGFIVPGTYQDYLDLEYTKPSGIVVSRSIY
ncbi:membrane protein, putative [Streptococcus infantis SK1302]|uniref:Membrane protein, putative n=1 Tax=Streptococcus infantis SK1302 TaxID=871237 RepID=A0ABN0B4J7_9STRE|nr:membrane protein, putative [Streptococcus infantis SK1302]